jgi:protein SCO1/2
MRRGAFLGLAVAIAAAVCAGVGLFALKPSTARNIAIQTDVKIGGPFTLVDQRGRTVTDRDLRGKPTAMFFGFTYCPEICPTTLAALTAWMKALGPDADRLNAVYVTIDPERDTPQQMELYLRSFDPRIRGLSGSPAQIAKIAKAYRVYYQKVPLPDGGYTMDHSSVIYLMDAHGDFSGVITYQEPPDQALAKLRALIRA